MAERAKRREVVTSVEEAAQLIRPGMTIMLGGFGTVNHSMAVVRQLIRNRVTNLTVIGSATAGLEVDMLIGAGCVRKLIAPYVGAELLCPIGHCFRRAAEKQEVEIWECSEYILYAGLYARSMGLGFMPWRGGLGTDIPRLNKDLKEFRDPLKGERYLAIPAIEADWALIHVGWADAYGNGQHPGARFGDRLFARAADRVMLTAERIVPNSVIRRNPFMTSVAYADVVVEAPYGSHPFASHGFYTEDLEHIREYVRVTEEYRKGDKAPWLAYLERYVHAPSNHGDYLELIGTRKLLSLQQTTLPVGGA